MKNIWSNERTEIATWLSGYLSMFKTWVDKILDNEHYDVDKNKIIGLIDEWIAWLQETRLKIMKMRDVDPEHMGLQNSRPEGDGTEYVIEKDEDGNLYRRAIGSEEREIIKEKE